MQLFFSTKNFKKFLLTFVFGLVMFSAFSVARTAEAATLSLVPSATTVEVGNIVTLNVLVNTNQVAINNSDAIIQFPTDLLQVISVSKSSSIFTLWVEDPSFSNITGQVTFNGGITNPGYLGSGGQLLSITFRAKKAGTASVLFSDSSVRANDGLGTNVLIAKNGAVLAISSSAVAPVTPIAPVVSNTSPSLPGLKISSSTHPDQNAWYSDNNAIFEWKFPSQTKTVQTAIDTDPSGAPHVTYTPAISKKEVANVGDGVSYFHLRYMTASGWSAISTYKIQVDTVAP